MNDTGNQNQCMSSLFDFVDSNNFSKANNDEIFKKIDRQINAIRSQQLRLKEVGACPYQHQSLLEARFKR